MAKSVQKSPGFDKNLDAERMIKQIQSNMDKLALVAKENANQIAPLDTGKLRNSTYITSGHLTFSIVWSVDYAEKVFNKNLKNPQTTRWTEKDFRKNRSRYLELMKRGVVK